MKKTASILIVLLLLGLLAGCGAERVSVDISDGGDLSAPLPGDTEEVAGPEETQMPQEKESQPAEPEYVTLSYEGNTASATVDSVYLNDEGNLTVKIIGTGYAFNGVIPFRNGGIVVPFRADVQVGGVTHSWNYVNFSGEEITYSYDVSEMPEQVILYSITQEDEKFIFDAAPYITDGPPAIEQPEDDSPELSELAGRWSGTGRPVGGGEEISLRIDLQEDGTGTYRFRQGEYSESYPVSVNDEDGSFSAEIPADNQLQITGCGGTYEYNGTVLSLHIVTEFASGRSFEYEVDCERVPPAETVTDEPYTMVTSKFSVSGTYTGEWLDGMPNGAGTLTIQETNDRWDTGDTLWSEDWVDGLIEGYGEWRSAVDGAYDGNFSAGLKDGYGKMWFADGKVYDGQWSAGAFNG